jgi:hypothetical protein
VRQSFLMYPHETGGPHVPMLSPPASIGACLFTGVGMETFYDIYLGRLGARNTRRVAKNQTTAQVDIWKSKGYRLQAERRVAERLHEIYFISA